jgi:hypothetical protein
MTDVAYVVLATKHVPDTRNTEITISTPDHQQATVTVPDTLVGSAVVDTVIRRALAVRQESIDVLQPVDE